MNKPIYPAGTRFKIKEDGAWMPQTYILTRITQRRFIMVESQSMSYYNYYDIPQMPGNSHGVCAESIQQYFGTGLEIRSCD